MVLLSPVCLKVFLNDLVLRLLKAPCAQVDYCASTASTNRLVGKFFVAQPFLLKCFVICLQCACRQGRTVERCNLFLLL